MSNEMQENLKFIGQVLLSIATFGVTWVVSNQAAVVTALAILIVWLIKYLAERRDVYFSKVTITSGLYLVSFVLVIIVNPGILPAWPVMTGDAVEVIKLIALWLREAVVVMLPYTGAAMSIYNLLLKSVLDQLPDMFGVSTETIG